MCVLCCVLFFYLHRKTNIKQKGVMHCQNKNPYCRRKSTRIAMTVCELNGNC